MSFKVIISWVAWCNENTKHVKRWKLQYIFVQWKKQQRFRIPITESTHYAHARGLRIKKEKEKKSMEKKKVHSAEATEANAATSHSQIKKIYNYFHATWRRIVRMPCMSTYFHDLNGLLFCFFCALVVSFFFFFFFSFRLNCIISRSPFFFPPIFVEQKNDERQQWQDKIIFYL